MTIVKAIEYTRKVDDGVLPHLWDECDIMLIGPSRAGKTPLSFYLAQRGYKVANYPLVPEEEPPKDRSSFELFELDQQKCFALQIKPERLQEIRTQRMKQFNRSNTKYANLTNIKKEVSWIKNFYLRKGPKWPIIDTSNAGVVETAARIMEILDRRKGDAVAASYQSSEACAFLAHLVRQALYVPKGSVNIKRFLEGASQAAQPGCIKLYRAELHLTAVLQEFYELSGLAERSGPGIDEMKWLVTSSPARETERCWNWKHETLDIAGTLAARGWSYNGYPVSADYFGSYSLDGLAGALWAVYHSRRETVAVIASDQWQARLQELSMGFLPLINNLSSGFRGGMIMRQQFVPSCGKMVCQMVPDPRGWLEVHFFGLGGGDFCLSVPDDILGGDLLQAVRDHLPRKPGAILSLFFNDAKLSMSKTLKEQCMQESPSVHYVYLHRNALDAWKQLNGLQVESEHALDGMIQLGLEGGVIQNLEQMNFPSSLEVLTFGENFDQSLERARFPSDLLSLTFQPFFNRSLECVNFPSGLKSLTFGWLFNQSLEGVSLPSSLQSLTFGGFFNQSLDNVRGPEAEEEWQEVDWVTWSTGSVTVEPESFLILFKPVGGGNVKADGAHGATALCPWFLHDTCGVDSSAEAARLELQIRTRLANRWPLVFTGAELYGPDPNSEVSTEARAVHRLLMLLPDERQVLLGRGADA
eukprot:g24042.t1